MLLCAFEFIVEPMSVVCIGEHCLTLDSVDADYSQFQRDVLDGTCMGDWKVWEWESV